MAPICLAFRKSAGKQMKRSVSRSGIAYLRGHWLYLECDAANVPPKRFLIRALRNGREMWLASDGRRFP